MRSSTNRTSSCEAALDDLGDDALDRDAELLRLLELGARLGTAAELDPQREHAAGVADHARLDRVAELDQQLALGVADLGPVELALRLAADVDEHRLLADRDHLAADLVTDAGALRAWSAALALGEHRSKVFVLIGHARALYAAIAVQASDGAARDRQFAPARASLDRVDAGAGFTAGASTAVGTAERSSASGVR